MERSQLSAENPYFPHVEGCNYIEEVNWTRHEPESWQTHLCAVCGLRGTGKCPLQQEYFCGPEHQRAFKKKTNMTSVYPLFQLVVESEPDATTGDGDGNDFDIVDNEDDEEDAALEQGDLNAMTGTHRETSDHDDVTTKFYDRISSRPNVRDQCLRYDRWWSSSVEDNVDGENNISGGEGPLWIQANQRLGLATADEQQPEHSLPPRCHYCGSSRRFECQLMPQMLHYLLQKTSDDNREPDQNIGATTTKVSDQVTESATTSPATSGKSDDWATWRQALQATDAVLEQTPPSLVPPAMVENRNKVVQRAQQALMKNNSVLDWGVVAIYTCTNSCGGGGDETRKEADELGSYREEFAWLQPAP